MPGISVHVVDVSRGVVASGMFVEVAAILPSGNERLIASAEIAASGLLDVSALAARQSAGAYEARFHVAAYYRQAGIELPPVPFLDVVRYGFGISDPDAHYHLPFKCTPWGYSCFRGGA